MNRNGLSLLEIMIATGILVAAMVPLWGLMGASHKQVTISADEIKVSQLALEIIEQIENSQWTPVEGEMSFSPGSNSSISLGSKSKINIQIGEFPDYLKLKGKVEISGYPTGKPDKGKIVNLKLFYNPKEKVGKEDKVYSISTYIPGK